MMRYLKKTISVIMCIAVMLCAVNMGTTAAYIGDTSKLNYKGYTYIGDSIPWGYALMDVDPLLPEYTFVRFQGSYGDILGTALEKQNGAKVYCAASPGARLCDFRYIVDRINDVEEPYSVDDWFSQYYAPERTAALRGSGDALREGLENSDLITIELGMNDLFCAPILTLLNSGTFDSEDEGESANKIVDILTKISKSPQLLAEVAEILADGVISFRENMKALVNGIQKIIPENSDIVLVGSYNLFRGMKLTSLVPGTALLEILARAFEAANTYMKKIADQYDDVYFVDIPETELFFPEGTVIKDTFATTSGLDELMVGIHPTAKGHEYIASRIVERLNSKGLEDEHNISITLNLAQRVTTTAVNNRLISGTYFDGETNKLMIPYRSDDAKTVYVTEERSEGTYFLSSYKVTWSIVGYTSIKIYSIRCPAKLLSLFIKSGADKTTAAIKSLII